jgi:ankyrin repeat protein
MLWLRGYAGVGKSVITKYLITDVLKAHYIESKKLPSTEVEKSSGHTPFLAYFFCSERNRHLQSESNILMSILHQLLSAAPLEVTKALAVFRQRSTYYSFLLKPQLLWEALRSSLIATNWTTTYLVFDGLDEVLAEHLATFSTGLKALVESVVPQIEPRSLKILVTSRPLPSLEDGLSCPSISVRSERDVRHFVQGSTSELAGRYALSLQLQLDIVERISEKAKGMFLWAVLAWYELCRNAIRPEDFATNLLKLQTFPTTLEMLYEDILNRLPPSSRRLALNALTWLTLSARPLHCDELRFAIAMMETSDNYQATLQQMIGRMELRTLCPELITVGEDGYVQFVHSSIKDFFLSPKTSAQYRIDPVKLHSTIATFCVQSLYMQGFNPEDVQAELINTQVRIESEMIDLPVKYLLLPYAATNWHYHASMAGEDLKVWIAFKTLLENPSSVSLWLMLALYDGSLSAQKGWYLGKDFWGNLTLPPAIHIAVFLKNIYFIEKLVESGAQINQLNTTWERMSEGYCMPRLAIGGTILHSPNLDRELLQVLISLGADMNALDRDGISALSRAVHEHDEDKVTMMLGFAKSQREATSSVGYDPKLLNQAAIMTMKKAVLEILDDPLIDLSHARLQDRYESILGTYHTSPLEHACLLGMTSIANILMNHPRMLAAQKRLELRLPNRNPTSVAFLTALHGWDDLTLIALQNFHTELERERDMNGRTILMHAAMEEWHYVLEHCINRLPKSSLNMQDKNGRTALHHAARMRNWFGTDKLLTAGADFSTEDHEGMTPAHAAAEAGSERVLRIILDKRAFGVDSIDHQKRNLLHYVVTWNFYSITETLIDIAPNQVSAKDFNGRTPVHLAALFGSTAVLALLLSKGLVGINAQDHVGKTLLHLAVESEIESCIDELLSREETDLNMMDRNLRSPHDITQGFKDQAQAERVRIMLEDAGCRPGLWRPRCTNGTYQAVSNTEVAEPFRDPKDWQLIWSETMDKKDPVT